MDRRQRIGLLSVTLNLGLCVAGARLAVAQGGGPFGYIGAADQVHPQQAGFRQRRLFTSTAAVLDPTSHQPIQFVHVDLGAAANGDGTFEHPFNTVSAALAVATRGDVVYVRGGASGTTAGFAVPAGVRVLSTGPAQVIATASDANYPVPLSGKGALPKVTGTVTVSDDTTLSGFDITTDTGAGIEGRDVAGEVEISHNAVRNAGDGNSGIQVLNTKGEVTLRIDDNAVSGGKTSGIQIKNDGTSRITAAVTNNRATSNVGSGIFFYLFRGQLKATVSNNTTLENHATIPQESGIRVGVFNDAQGTVTLTGNRSENNYGNGIFVGSEGISLVSATITDNIANGNTGHGIFEGATQDGTVTGIITGNTANDNKVNPAFAPFPTGSGIFVGAQVNGRAAAVIQNNTTRGNGDLGIFCFVGNNGAETVYVQNNTSVANVRTGIEVNVGLNGGPGNPAAPGDMPEATAVVSDNTVTDNMGIGPPLGGGGIFVLAFNRAIVRTAIRNNVLRNNAQTQGAFGAMGLVTVQNAQIFATVQGNTFAGNGGSNPSFTPLTGVPDTVLGGALTGPGHICLRLTENNSDSGYALVRPGGTTLQADTPNNVGPVIAPAAPIDPLGDCPVPG